MSDPNRKMRTLQTRLLFDELRDGLEHVEPYGFTAEPKLDGQAEAFALFFDGERSHGVVISVADRRYRITGMRQGEVALYDDLGQRIYLTRDGIRIETPKRIDVVAGSDASVRVAGNAQIDVAGKAAVTCPSITFNASEKVTFNTPLLDCSGLIKGGGGLAISGGSGATVDGSLTTTGDVTAAGISLDSHTHTGVESGPSSTGGPQ